ncbi:MAG TPA: phytoene/squalene synthase family protein [Pseudolabrys sp.]
MATNFEHCAALVREADRDRYLATLFAPAQHRDALFALYAFNVEIARVRDLAREPMPGEIRLQWWREVLSGLRGGEAAANPVAAALLAALTHYRLGSERLLALIDAHGFDLYDEPMASATDLEIYGIKTQSVLFAMAAEILGSKGAASEMVTLDAGIAYAIASILQDFARHAARRQLYVPLDVLTRLGVNREDIFAGQSSAGLLAALTDMRVLARKHLAPAQEKLKGAPSETFPALLPAALVAPALRRMEKKGYDPFTFEPAPAWRRQWWLWRAARNPRRIFSA